MTSLSSRKVKVTPTSSSISVKDQRDVPVWAFHLIRRANQTSGLAAISSLTLYGVAVSGPINAFCTRETVQGSLSVQGIQYVLIVLSGMLLGIAIGPWLERVSHGIWRLLTQPASSVGFRRSQTTICVTILSVSFIVNLLFLLPWLNRFVDIHSGLKTEVVLLTYAMGVLTGGAWYMLLYRQAGWGLIISCGMSMMVVSSALSIHSW